MPSFRHTGALALVVILSSASAQAQQQAQGFAVERFYPSAPGGGWLVMDALDMHGSLGGAMALTIGYAGAPLRVTDGVNHLAVVSDQAFANLGLALSYDRWRLALNLETPLAIIGQSGTVGAYSFTGPSVNPGSNPDTISDARFALDGRIVGKAHSRFRFGAGMQLLIPNGNRADYDTDGTFRGMGRLLFAGDVGMFSYAAQLGVHIRPLDDGATPGSPRGSELLFGVAGGARLPVGKCDNLVVIIGPEVFGASAFRNFFGATGTALEGLLAARLEGTRSDRLQVRVKLGLGAGLNQHFGAAEWRIVVAAEIFNHHQK